MELATGGGQALAIDVTGLLLSAALLSAESAGQADRLAQRAATRDAQLAAGDRVAANPAQPSGGTKLAQVDDKWIVRRLERMAAAGGLPMVGPVKGKILQDLIRRHGVSRALEVGTFLGYSAILMAQALPPGGQVVTLEADWANTLASRRFLWQCNQGDRSPGEPRVGQRVKVLQGDAAATMARLAASSPEVRESFQLLFLDAAPKDALAQLEAALPLLAPGCVVVADNAVVFAASLAPYLAAVREKGGRFESSTLVEMPLEWTGGKVADGMEVSILRGGGAAAAAGAAGVGVDTNPRPR